MAIDLQHEQQYNDPVTIFGDDYVSLQSFFQYSFPPKRLSAQALGLQEILTDTQKDDLYLKMLTAVGMSDQDVFFTDFLVQTLRINLPCIQQMGLTDSTLTFDRRKGFSQITNANGNRKAEHKVTAISRRLRDSFAHGRIGTYGDYLLYEDATDKSITGRIILKKDDLKTWKDVIE